jgi:hypothetical protein
MHAGELHVRLVSLNLVRQPVMKVRHLALLSLFIAACHRVTEVRGLYAYQSGVGTFFPCDDPNTMVYVPDTVLAARYRAVVDSSGIAFVRLRGISTRSGSIYSGRPYFIVQQVLEIRARGNEDCPKITRRVLSVLAP